MIFSSYQFLVVFLPIALLGYELASRLGPKCAATWLAMCSIAFYAFWNVYFVTLLILSILFNFVIGRAILRNEDHQITQRVLLTIGISCNLLVLFFFKYFATVFKFMLDIGLIHDQSELAIILPLGISFFTFTQIGYLVDCQQGLGKNLSLIHYVVFVTLFPHLIAGPILHIREMAPQLLSPATYGLAASNLAVGFSYFILGLSKKVLLADPLAAYANAGFAHPAMLDFNDTWATASTYSLQLYFDFSGYSDMAIGLAYMFGFKFPINFNSPYKARCIIDFWQRWHITLTRYLTLLLFNPISLWVVRRRISRGLPVRSRRPTRDQFAGTVILPTVYTMLLAGVWHGAGIQFLIFGLLHAFYLSINHIWRAYGTSAPRTPRQLYQQMSISLGQLLLTYLCVLVAQIFFRAASTGDAVSMLSAMMGLQGFNPIYVPVKVVALLGGLGIKLSTAGWITSHFQYVWPPRNVFGIFARYVLVLAMPNTQQIMAKFAPYLEKVEVPNWRILLWRPNVAWGVGLSLMLVLDLLLLNNSPPFLYFQF